MLRNQIATDEPVKKNIPLRVFAELKSIQQANFGVRRTRKFLDVT